MNEPAKTDHWGQIASALGAEPPPEEEKPQEQSVEEAPSGNEGPKSGSPPVARPTKPRPKPAPKREPADWSRLAADLGLSPPVEPPATTALAETPQREEEDERAEISPPPAASFLDIVAAEAEEGQLLPGFEELADELDDTGPLLSDDGPMPTDATLDDGGLPPQVESERESDVIKEAGKRRRKRRRRPRKPLERETAQPPPEPALPDAEDAAGGREELPLPGAVVQEDPEGLDTVAPASVQAETAGKSKRRRRRRTSDRKRADVGDGTDRLPEEAGELLAEGEDAIGPRASDQGDAESPPAADRDKATGDQAGKVAHRGIPTWREAVDIVISANLEARAKRPSDRSSSRQRSGRRQPRKGKSSDKPT